MKRKFQVLWDCCIKNRLSLFLLIAVTLVNGCVFDLYDLPSEPFFYGEALLTAVCFALFFIDFSAELRAADRRKRNAGRVAILESPETEEATLRDRDYGEMLRELAEEISRLREEFSRKQQADDDYYTAWVHQIKTPIAVMKLLLSGTAGEHTALSAELFRVEQYVEMVLDYIRLESSENDLVIRPYPLDEVIREILRKFAPQFILKKIRISYEPTDVTVVTDKRWLGFILEQLISNGLKYTKQGMIRITAEEGYISVSDTGMGIAPEDLPRIFEKGYTGNNGRLGQQSSGLGLFLVDKAAKLLKISVTAESTVGKGSVFTVHFPKTGQDKFTAYLHEYEN